MFHKIVIFGFFLLIMIPFIGDIGFLLLKNMKRVGAIILLREDGAALLQHRDDLPDLTCAGMWVFPGGHCEVNESMEDCARREFLEETAYLCDEIYFLSKLDNNLDEDVGFYWAWYDNVQSVQCLEGQALEFISRDMADTLYAPAYLTDIWDLAIKAALDLYGIC